jgi:AcrR family transcriptional regulator
MPETPAPGRTRGHKKKERTRRQLVEAGVRVLAARGEGLTVSDVVAEAEVSNGTFYNYFPDREAFIDAVTEHSALALAADAAKRPIEDPAERFAVATMGMLRHARRDETWARVMLRLVGRPGSGLDLSRYLSEDLDEGHALGRFAVGAEDAALDQVAGLVVMTMRRFVDGRAGEGAERAAVERGLVALGVDPVEASALAEAAEAAFAS